MPRGAHRKAARFVCVHNRNRDNYEVALALEQAGLLERLVTDFYLPDRLKLPGSAGRRKKDGLSAAKVRSSLLSSLIQYSGQILGLAMERVFARSDAILASSAARLARSSGAGLYAYSSYLAAEPDLPEGCPVIDFEYHPHPDFSLALLEADADQYPEVAWSLARERQIAASEPLNSAWQSADAVVCASSITRRSLVAAGCPESRISVIPYGCSEAAEPLVSRKSATCRFLFVGQGIQRKGLHHLARAWRQAGLANAELVIASYLIDPGIAPLLEQGGITRLGQQDRASLNALLANADVFVMPSLMEGFGLVYLEALSAGCHVIGTTNTGLPDLPLSDRAATIIAPGDIGRLAEVLTELARAKHNGTLDPETIQREAQGWTWANFRQGIADHAAGVLGEADHGSQG